ncbi:MAG: hypothetical protein MJ136_02605 [Clostridia bacterium]|nr:hypothetical protein [Clostridia bacterium]
MLFGVRQVRTWFQYLLFTLGRMGYIMALGRYLFPMLALWLALYYSQRANVKRRPWLYALAAVLPVLSMVVYYPTVFEGLVGLSSGMIMLLVNASLAWIVLYLLLAVLLMALELHDTTMRFYKRQFGGRLLMVIGLIALYAVYCPQDPAQVYLFYRNEYMGAQQGLWYLNPALNPVMYAFIFVLFMVSAISGIVCTLRYARDSILEGQEEKAIRRKFDATSKGASVFVHSVKNQLLANRVLLKRIGAELEADEPDKETLRLYHRQLAQNNDYMIGRMEELYRGIRTNSISLVP